MKIVIETILHKEQAYETVGNYVFDKKRDTYFITVSKSGNKIYDFAVMIHELWELALVLIRNIPINEIDEFDMTYIANGGKGEPGDEVDAPYRDEHCSATGIERLFIAENKIAWKDYDDTLNKL